MRKWLIWSGLAFAIGGAISLAMTISVEEVLDPREDLTPYSVGWIIAGIVMIAAGFILKIRDK